MKSYRIERGLNSAHMEQVLKLSRICDAFESIDVPLFIETDAERNNIESPNIRAYDGDTLVGFAYITGQDGPEVSGMVHPDHRRHGIGTLLLRAAIDTCRKQGASSLLLVCDDASPSGRAFAESAGASHQFSEYGMVYDPDSGTADEGNDTVELRRATIDEAATVIRIQAAAFGDNEDDVRHWVIMGLQQPNRRYYLGYVDDEPVGTIRLTSYEESADITAFGVLPTMRGRGIGRQMLRQSVVLLRADGYDPITLEVVTENASALGLYRSCGFRERTTYAYYRLPLG